MALPKYLVLKEIQISRTETKREIVAYFDDLELDKNCADAQVGPFSEGLVVLTEQGERA